MLNGGAGTEIPVERIEEFIRANLSLESIPFVPEIRLYKAGPRSGLRRLAEADETFGTPYWAHYWSGGLALARYIIDHPQATAGKQVLDLGTGSGLVAIAAALAGASQVSAADTDRHAFAAAGLNSRANGVDLRISLDDLTRGAPPAVDVVTVADLFYDRSTAEQVTDFLRRCMAVGIAVLVGDPWRAHLPESQLHEIARYTVCEMTGTFKPTAKPSGVCSPYLSRL